MSSFQILSTTPRRLMVGVLTAAVVIGNLGCGSSTPPTKPTDDAASSSPPNIRGKKEREGSINSSKNLKQGE